MACRPERAERTKGPALRLRGWARRERHRWDFLAPAAARKIRQRDRFFRMLPYLPPARSLVRRLSTRTATAIKLPEYP